MKAFVMVMVALFGLNAFAGEMAATSVTEKSNIVVQKAKKKVKKNKGKKGKKGKKAKAAAHEAPAHEAPASEPAPAAPQQ